MKMPVPARKQQREIQEELFCGLLPACVTWSLAHTCDFGEWWLLGKAEQTLWVSFSLFCYSRIQSFLTLPHAASVITMRGFCAFSQNWGEKVCITVSASFSFLFSLSLFFFFFTNLTQEKPKESMKVRWSCAFKLLIWLV